MANGRFKITVVSKKEEMNLNGGRFDLKSLSLGKRIKQCSDEKRLRPNICELAASGYHVYDGYPNDQGYAQLMDCLLRHHKA